MDVGIKDAVEASPETKDDGEEEEILPRRLRRESEDSDTESVRALRKRLYAPEPEHCLRHKPAAPDKCWACLRGKTRFLRKMKARSIRRQPRKFGELYTFDHVYMKDGYGQPGIGGFADLLTGFDRGTRTYYADPVDSLDAMDTFTILNQIEGDQKIIKVYSDDYPSYRLR